MCIYANAFVAGKNRGSLMLPENPPGLKATLDGEMQPKFIDKFKDVEGVFLVLHDGHCLCQYDEWGTLFEFMDSIRQANDVNRVPVMVFFSGSEYQSISQVDVDLELDAISERPEEGDILFVGVSVNRRLAASIGCQISLLFKSGKTLTGVLEEFMIEEEYGRIDVKGESIYFSANEIRHVDTIV
ncbi:MAG: hypothetical protein ACFFE2_16840 [Candidatus Thorarchaeota archaeon]